MVTLSQKDQIEDLRNIEDDLNMDHVNYKFIHPESLDLVVLKPKGKDVAEFRVSFRLHGPAFKMNNRMVQDMSWGSKYLGCLDKKPEYEELGIKRSASVAEISEGGSVGDAVENHRRSFVEYMHRISGLEGEDFRKYLGESIHQDEQGCRGFGSYGVNGRHDNKDWHYFFANFEVPELYLFSQHPGETLLSIVSYPDDQVSKVMERGLYIENRPVPNVEVVYDYCYTEKLHERLAKLIQKNAFPIPARTPVRSIIVCDDVDTEDEDIAKIHFEYFRYFTRNYG